MKKLFFLIIGISLAVFANAQNDEKDKRPVWDPFNATLMIESQTPMGISAKSLQYIIHHRFGQVESISDLYGLYAPSNIRMGLNYGITDKLMVGIGTEKNNKLQEIHAKYTIFQQTRSNSMPVMIAYYTALNISAAPDEVYGKEYAFTDRFSYFNQLLIGRKFSDKISAQVGGSFSHFNAVDRTRLHDAIGVNAGVEYNVNHAITVLAEYNHPIAINEWTEEKQDNEFKPNLAFGVNFKTGTHAFQVFATNYENIMSARNHVYNTNEISEFVLGFNITVRF